MGEGCGWVDVLLSSLPGCWGWDLLGWGLWGDAHPCRNVLGQVFPMRANPSPSATTRVSPPYAHPRAWHPPWRQAGPGGEHIPGVAGTPLCPPALLCHPQCQACGCTQRALQGHALHLD